MKTKVLCYILFWLISGVKVCIAQDHQNFIDTIFENRRNYIITHIPDRYIFFYKPFTEIDHNIIIDTLKNLTSRWRMNESKNWYLVEFIPDDYRTKLYGVFWNDKNVISYKWDNLNKNIKIILDDFLDMSKPFITDIEKWDEFVTNRSYRFTSIAGAWYVLCSQIVIRNNSIMVNDAAFREYDKKHFEYYLKEKSFNHYLTIKVKNPNYKKEIQ